MAREKPLLQKRQEGKSVEVQAAQYQFGPWENQELGFFTTLVVKVRKGEEGKWNSPHGFNQEAGLKTYGSPFQSELLHYPMTL